MHIDPDSFRAFKQSLFNSAATDWLGVYETWWEANGTFGELTLSERLEIAELAVRELLDSQVVELYRGSLEGPFETVPPDEYDAVLRSWETWVIPEGPKLFLGAEEPADPASWQAILDSL